MTLPRYLLWQRLYERVIQLFCWTLLPFFFAAGNKYGAAILWLTALLLALFAVGLLCINQMQLFQCPRCAKSPHEWSSGIPDPMNGEVDSRYEPQTRVCLHCDYRLRD